MPQASWLAWLRRLGSRTKQTSSHASCTQINVFGSMKQSSWMWLRTNTWMYSALSRNATSCLGRYAPRMILCCYSVIVLSTCISCQDVLVHMIHECCKEITINQESVLDNATHSHVHFVKCCRATWKIYRDCSLQRSMNALISRYDRFVWLNSQHAILLVCLVWIAVGIAVGIAVEIASPQVTQ
jgi:hypothetical protein